MVDKTLWTTADSQRLGEKAKEMIQARTRQGRGADGKNFAPLEDGSKSTLTRTGRLLNSLEIRPSEDGVKVEATAPYAAFVGDKRPFLGLTQQEEQDLAEDVEKTLAARADALLDRSRR